MPGWGFSISSLLPILCLSPIICPPHSIALPTHDPPHHSPIPPTRDLLPCFHPLSLNSPSILSLDLLSSPLPPFSWPITWIPFLQFPSLITGTVAPRIALTPPPPQIPGWFHKIQCNCYSNGNSTTGIGWDMKKHYMEHVRIIWLITEQSWPLSHISEMDHISQMNRLCKPKSLQKCIISILLIMDW